MFNRIISIDWSGAGSENEGVDLRVAWFDSLTGQAAVVDRQVGRRIFRSWSRSACRDWLVERLREEVSTLVAMDFGFGLPWSSDQSIFEVQGWRPMVRQLGELYSEFGTARATAQAINDFEQFNGHGPYRFDENRTDFRFYLDKGVAYYRLTELLSPQAISQWYLGSGGTVGFHTITGLAAVHQLLVLREQGQIDFEVWPHDTLSPNGTRHVLVESYPSMCPRLDDFRPDLDDHQRDAWRVLMFLKTALENDTLLGLFEIAEQPFGRISGLAFEQQVRFEGYILGLK